MSEMDVLLKVLNFVLIHVLMVLL